MTTEPTFTQRELDQMRASIHYATVSTDVPEDIDVFRLAMTRRILAVCKLPERCRERVCRRSKMCVGLTIRCLRDFPPAPMTAEEDAAHRAAMYKMIQRIVAEGEAKADAEAEAG